MIEFEYSTMPEMRLKIKQYGDIGGNAQMTDIILTAEAQPFIVNGEEQKTIEFTVVGTRELSELINCLNAFKKLPH